jgi:predicted kinase
MDILHFKMTGNKQTLYLIRGVPGSGKSTLAYQLFNSGLVDHVFEADEYFIKDGEYQFDSTKLSKAHLHCQQRTVNALLEGLNVCVSNTSTTRKEIETYEQIAKQFGATFVSVIVENRHGNRSLHGVPEDKLQQMKDRFDVKL